MATSARPASSHSCAAIAGSRSRSGECDSASTGALPAASQARTRSVIGLLRTAAPSRNAAAAGRRAARVAPQPAFGRARGGAYRAGARRPRPRTSARSSASRRRAAARRAPRLAETKRGPVYMTPCRALPVPLRARELASGFARHLAGHANARTAPATSPLLGDAPLGEQMLSNEIRPALLERFATPSSPSPAGSQPARDHPRVFIGRRSYLLERFGRSLQVAACSCELGAQIYS